jgi:hypothetical protein
MRSVHVAVLLVLSLPAGAQAKAWQGITPGSSTRDDVIARFGEPSTQGDLGGQTALVYREDRAIAGTRQAQFVMREGGVVAEVNVFPATQLDRESVEGTYGKATQKSFTEDFRPVWIYRPVGVTVFFGKDGHVEAIRFEPGAPPAQGAPAAAKRKTQGTEGRAPGATPVEPAPRSPAAAAPPPRSPAPAAPAPPPPPAPAR